MNVRQALIAKKRYGFGDLVAIMSILRGPGGCPWDAEQTHASIRMNLLEEAYEVAEAIDKHSPAMLKEELGDLLLQVVFHAEIASEGEGFGIDDVCDGICRKLILRHPHIFADAVAETPEAVLKNWDDIKRAEKGHATRSQTLRSVPKTLPALMKSQKLQQKAAKAGFDWPDIEGPIQKLYEELTEFKEALKSGRRKDVEDELGDMLFSIVNIARFAGVDAEKALSGACEKFTARFERMEDLANAGGQSVEALSPEALDRLWEAVKHSY